MKIAYSILCILFLSGAISAQDKDKKQVSGEQKPVSSNTVTAASQKTIDPGHVKTDGVNLTPEEQGYTKHIVNGKEVYVKEQGQMMFYYEPKK